MVVGVVGGVAGEAGDSGAGGELLRLTSYAEMHSCAVSRLWVSSSLRALLPWSMVLEGLPLAREPRISRLIRLN